MLTKSYDIAGMGCIHCVAKVEKALLGLPQVVAAEVTLDPPLAKVTLSEPIAENIIRETVSAAGHYDASEKKDPVFTSHPVSS